METPDNVTQRRLRVVLVFRGEPLEDRSFAVEEPWGPWTRPARITLGQDGRDTFAIPVCPLPPSFPLLRAVAGQFVLTLSEGMVGRLHLSGEEMSVQEFFAARRGIAVGPGQSGLREQVLGESDWAILGTESSATVAFFFQFLPQSSPATDLHPRPTWPARPWLDPIQALCSFLPFQVDPFLQRALALSAVVSLLVLLLAFLAWEPQNPLVLDPPPGSRLARLLMQKRLETQKWQVQKQDSGLQQAPVGGYAGLAGKFHPARGALRPLLSDDSVEPKAAPVPAQSPLVPTPPPQPQQAPPPQPPEAAKAPAESPPPAKAPPKASAPASDRSPAAPAKAPKALVQSGAPVSEGPLSRAQIDRVVTFHQDEVEACYHRELPRLQAPALRMMVVWDVDAGGTVTHARVDSGTHRDGQLEACVLQKVLKWRFPTARGTTTGASVPFVFRHP